MPVGEWTHFDLRFQVGANAAHTYQVDVTAPGAEKRSYTLPIDSPDFHVFSWIGIIADDDRDGGFYLDNLSLRADPPTAGK